MNDNGEIAMEGYYGKDHDKTEHKDVKTMRDLNQYIQSETGKSKKPAKCNLCGKAFERKYLVRQHLAYKHFSYLFTEYTCKICGKNLATKESYAHHMKKKHPWSNGYQMNDCKYAKKDSFHIWKFNFLIENIMFVHTLILIPFQSFLRCDKIQTELFDVKRNQNIRREMPVIIL